MTFVPVMAHSAQNGNHTQYDRSAFTLRGEANTLSIDSGNPPADKTATSPPRHRTVIVHMIVPRANTFLNI